jgi:hypothetical protein
VVQESGENILLCLSHRKKERIFLSSRLDANESVFTYHKDRHQLERGEHKDGG